MDVGVVRSTLQALSQVPYAIDGGRLDDIIYAQSLVKRQFTQERVKESLTSEDIAQLEEFYRDRWEKVALTSDDYTTTQKGVNQHLIDLSLALYEAKLVKDPYQLLMPTLKTVIESYSNQPYHDWPLDKFTINDALTALIHIDLMKTAVGHRNGYKIDNESYQLTDSERHRLRLKDAAFSASPLNIKTCQKLSKDTVLAIKQLVEAVVSDLGAYDDVAEDSEEFRQIIAAVDDFMKYAACLSDAESQALMSHPVYSLSDMPWTFYEFLNAVWGSGPLESDIKLCSTTQMRSLAKLVVDYMPEVKFNNETVKRWMADGKWANKSEKIQFADRLPFNQAEYRLRCLYLLVDIFSHPFSVMSGVELSFDKGAGTPVSNRVPQTAQKFYQVIEKAMEGKKSYSDAYREIVSSIAPSAKDAMSPTRSDDTQKWLESIASTHFWLRERNGTSYKELALQLFYFLDMKSSLKRERKDQYSDDILRALTSNSKWKSVEVAILCKRCYHELSKSDKEAFKTSCSRFSSAQHEETIEQQIVNAAFYRAAYYLSYKEKPASGLIMSLASASLRSDHALRKNLQEHFQSQALSLEQETLSRRVKNEIEKLPARLRFQLSAKGKIMAEQFLDGLGGSIAPSEDCAQESGQECARAYTC